MVITWRKIERLCTFSFDLGLFPALEVVALGLDADACDSFPNDVGSRHWKFSSILVPTIEQYNYKSTRCTPKIYYCEMLTVHVNLVHIHPLATPPRLPYIISMIQAVPQAYQERSLQKQECRNAERNAKQN